MKNVGVRVVSAALAACMMTSVLPVSAFAAVGMEQGAETGIAVQDVEQSEDADTVTYTLSGNCNGIVIDEPQKDVVIHIVGNVTTTAGILLRVANAKSLTIHGTGCEVDVGSGYLIAVQNMDETLTIKDGTYKSTGTLLNLLGSNRYTVELNSVTMEAGNIAVANNNANAEVIMEGGKYSNSSENAVLLNNGVLTVDGNAVVESTNGIAVQNNAGTVTFKNGQYTSANTTVFTNTNAKTNVYGGTFTRTDTDGRALINWGTLEIKPENGKSVQIESPNGTNGTVINQGGTLNFYGGTIEAPNGNGVVTVGNNGQTNFYGSGSIAALNAMVMQSGSSEVMLKDSEGFAGTSSDILLGKDQRFSLDPSYSGKASVRVFDPYDGRKITDGTTADQDLEFESHNGGYFIQYNADGYYELKQNREYVLSYEDATAVKVTGYDENGSEITENAPSDEAISAGTNVTLTPAEKDGKHCVRWEVTNPDSSVTEAEWNQKLLDAGLTAEALKTSTLAFNMPECSVHFKPVYAANAADPTDPDGGNTDDTGNTGSSGGDVGGAIAAGVVAGTVIWGAYEAGTGIYRMVNMYGIPLPSTRAELAMLIWERADKPEPESTALYDDIDEDDADLQKAARWMVEQELMDEKDNNKFKPYGHVTKLRVCTTWNEAKEKGLID